jgi:hypothetical protein
MTPDQRAANLIADFPAAQNISGLGRAISRVIRAAIQAEREACAGAGEELRQRDTATEGSYSDPKQADWSGTDMAAEIARRICERA